MIIQPDGRDHTVVSSIIQVPQVGFEIPANVISLDFIEHAQFVT